jgi:hypothetical protein
MSSHDMGFKENSCGNGDNGRGERYGSKTKTTFGKNLAFLSLMLTSLLPLNTVYPILTQDRKNPLIVLRTVSICRNLI